MLRRQVMDSQAAQRELRYFLRQREDGLMLEAGTEETPRPWWGLLLERR